MEPVLKGGRAEACSEVTKNMMKREAKEADEDMYDEFGNLKKKSVPRHIKLKLVRCHLVQGDRKRKKTETYKETIMVERTTRAEIEMALRIKGRGGGAEAVKGMGSLRRKGGETKIKAELIMRGAEK